MAKDMLQAVFNAEEECKLREINARAEASKRIQQAKADAVQLIKDAENDANIKAQAILDNEKLSGEKAHPIISGTATPSQKVFHANPHKAEKSISADVYPVIDTDLARDNAENDLTAADLQDL